MSKRDKPSISVVETLKSVLMSFLGVQKESIRQRDFKEGRPQDFIVIGLLVTIVFVLLLLGLVKVVIYMAGL